MKTTNSSGTTRIGTLASDHALSQALAEEMERSMILLSELMSTRMTLMNVINQMSQSAFLPVPLRFALDKITQRDVDEIMRGEYLTEGCKNLDAFYEKGGD